MEFIKKIIKPLVLLGAVALASSNSLSSAPVSIDAYISQIDSFLASSHGLDPKHVEKLVIFRNNLNSGNLDRAGLAIVYAELCRLGGPLLQQVNSFAGPIMRDPKMANEFMEELKKRKQKNAGTAQQTQGNVRAGGGNARARGR